MKSKVMFLSLILFLFTAGCQKTETAKQEGLKVIPVKVSRVQVRDLSEAIEYVGNIKAQDEAVVYSKVSGKIIEKLKKDGDIIIKGETLAYIDRDEVGLKFEKAPVESPMNGILGEIYVDIGQSVSPQTPIALAINMDKVKIILDLPEKYIPRITLAQEAIINVDAYVNEDFKGVITKITPIVDMVTRTAPVEITIDNQEHRLNSGMFANIRLIIQEHKVVPVVLKESLLGREPEVYVYTVEDNKAALKKVGLGVRQGPYVQITAGLKETDLVVIMGQQRLKDGMAVEAEE
ncbi:MAG: hypothetical protein COW11_05590 [Candidatus Omnitrophica bacterium CG12_big_fil_rev_8_21_14_0_65_43_15]|uniref:Uncharacterized protein n=1 Tax=Candidatus Taenaricola geysiri TaxID=1974752 RepID=A0A2J0LDS2_9BACT|nr:MAG: hypothetical protein AUJ89_01600 [Candidatus Omnitrophica bacterium CG1_02_43_210]PIR65528.1 MAG: hypothetical protein COU52_03735 [Candidatus Omnitrophica bacterium CG10_big_fil_rev_8_21_14_0_10_43_8]PIV11983.1 MAG: hypothetical protein COS48_03170 [Candidatus Omnitrophica bacterium CG03_land_8_20_14_0_80_43_22]PIW66001.1 MAG: hypothetical protein COW11_05590 [Candidatus Omnitrophica bacterium CG12_big_fil_rev_8_21_14_0_65_43_15]PIW80857.1 MAG: hypothetical protein COZ98_00215 [Candida